MKCNSPVSTLGHRVDVLGFRVFSDNLAVIPLEGPCATISTISPNSYGIAVRDSAFHDALTEADVLVLDGVYFGLSSILLKGKIIRANQGPDVFHHFMRRLDSASGRAFFLGATQQTLESIVVRARREYPSVHVATYSPPFAKIFSDAENSHILRLIAEFKPDVLFIGMTAPKQEKWAHSHKSQIEAHLAVSIGGVFDWYAGNEPEIARIWWKLRLVWLIRTIQRPEILKRYPNIIRFFAHLALAIFRLKRA